MPRIKNPTPTIKGLFVNSHVSRLREDKGEEAVRELERRYGGRVVFKALEDVPVREEVKIINLILDIQYGPVPPEQLGYEAGRLHFRNFATTALGQTLLSSLPHTTKGLRTLLMNAGSIGRTVFKHTNFTIRDDTRTISILMGNTDYPIEHFAGFFSAWIEVYGLSARNLAAHSEGSTHCYTISGF